MRESIKERGVILVAFTPLPQEPFGQLRPICQCLLLFRFLDLLQQRRHIGPQFAASFLFGFGEFGERLRIAQAGEVGVGTELTRRAAVSYNG